MDNCIISRNGSKQRPSIAWRWTPAECQRNLAVFGRFPPTCFVSSRPPPALPPLLLPVTHQRLGTATSGKLERVPTPTRADRLIIADEHDIAVCSTQPYQTPPIAAVEELNQLMSGAVGNDLVYHHRGSVDARNVAEDGDVMDGVWSAAEATDNDERRRATSGGAASKTAGEVTEMSDQRPYEVDRDVMAQHMYCRQPSRYRWKATAEQRRSDDVDVAKYWERRRKNNEAAKRSRDIRRANERRVALRAALLERENERLRSEVGALTEDTLRLHYHLLCSRTLLCSHCYQRHAGKVPP